MHSCRRHTGYRLAAVAQGIVGAYGQLRPAAAGRDKLAAFGPLCHPRRYSLADF